MFPNRVLSKMEYIEFVQVNMDRVTNGHDKQFLKKFCGIPLLLISENMYDIFGDSLCMFPVHGEGVHLLSSAICVIEEIRKSSDRYSTYTVGDVDCYSTEIRMIDYFGGGVGLVGVEDFLIDRIPDKEAGKYMLERL